MRRIAVSALLMGALCVPASAETLVVTVPSMGAPSQAAPPRYAAAAAPSLGGGLLEFLFGGGARTYQPANYGLPFAGEVHPPVDPKFGRQVVAFNGAEPPGTIVVDTEQKFLFLVQSGGKAMRYGIGVGREGSVWTGTETVTAKREWPDWRPPDEMLKRRPDLPRYMTGGPDNPLGARAMYLGSTLYRIHGTNEPWTIGTNVSSGCIRLTNEDVTDLYGRVKVGTKVVVL
jgi:lipoprotein-anchoring transpeptidase ErfK/SrfK